MYAFSHCLPNHYIVLSYTIFIELFLNSVYRLQTEDEPNTDQQQNTEVQATVQIHEETPIDSTEGPETSATIAIEGMTVITCRYLSLLAYNCFSHPNFAVISLAL